MSCDGASPFEQWPWPVKVMTFVKSSCGGFCLLYCIRIGEHVLVDKITLCLGIEHVLKPQWKHYDKYIYVVTKWSSVHRTAIITQLTYTVWFFVQKIYQFASETNKNSTMRETRSTQRAQTSLAETGHYSDIAQCKNVEPWWWKVKVLDQYLHHDPIM